MYNDDKILKKGKPLNVAAYCRVSTLHVEQETSLKSQTKHFSTIISGKEDWKLVEVFHDEETGLMVKNRDGFNRMIADALDGKIDWIITKEVSRFARNTLDTISYVRQLVAAGVGVTFTNNNICTSQPNYEFMLTFIAGQAQEESRVISERVKWGMYQAMENGFVLGKKKMLGFRINNGVISIVPEEAEIVRRIFFAYLYEGKGYHTIAKELNKDGLQPLYGGKIWHDNHIRNILKNEKYVGDLTQRKHYVKNYLTKERVANDGEEVPFIHIRDHHEAIIDRPTWDATCERMAGRKALMFDGRKPSESNWFSSKAICGKCGKPYNATSGTRGSRTLLCSNRSKHGKTITEVFDEKTKELNSVGCDNGGVNERVLVFIMAHILRHIQSKREEIVSELLNDVKAMQSQDTPADITHLDTEIDSFTRKKRKIIDLMTDDLISKSDFQEQKAYYDEEIAKLTEEVSRSRNLSAIHQQQIDRVKAHITEVNKTAEICADNTELYGELLDRFVINEDNIFVYLKCLPFGFEVKHRVERYAKKNKFDIFVEAFDIVA